MLATVLLLSVVALLMGVATTATASMATGKVVTAMTSLVVGTSLLRLATSVSSFLIVSLTKGSVGSLERDLVRGVLA